jgi:glycosyltransferase involved in cell wall biosynthesis
MKIVISAGSYKFHLSPLAVEIAKRGQLAVFITAGWPIGWQKWIAELFPKSRGWQRFLDRYEPIPNPLVWSIPTCEIVLKFGDVFIRKYSQKWQQKIHKFGFLIYANHASGLIKKTRPDIYHYRNCYGGKSVEIAKELGIVALCDHSIGHPICLDWMEKNSGAWPNIEVFDDIRKNTLPLYKKMEEDLSVANHVLVNSDFVKRTCIHAGMDPEKIHVAYLGIDNSFLEAISNSPKDISGCAENSLLYAGGWQRRKGVQTIVDALNSINKEWTLDIAGGVEPEAMTLPGMQAFFIKNNVKHLGIIPRNKLASLMRRHRIFIFPSYCEGSARVIFEAMAAGCYIITTENSGSIVEDNIHGRLIEPGDFIGLRDAIEEAFCNPQMVDEIRERNASLVLNEYTQTNYGNRVGEVYKDIISKNSIID